MTPQKEERVLTNRTRGLLGASDAERIQAIREDRWFGYPKAQEALRLMERLIDYPNVRRPPSLLLVAETNNGKTTIAERFLQLHPVIDDPAADRVLMPVVLLDAPSTPDEDRLYNHILNELGAVFRIRSPRDAKLFQIRHLLRDLGMRVLVFDEVNNMLAGNQTQRHQMFNAIKSLSNALKRPVILTGTFDALVVVREDGQIQNRCLPFVLPRWQYDDDYLQLLASFEATLPLKRASNLVAPELAELLLVMSQHVIGELHRLLTQAAEQAITGGSERITRTLLMNLKWIPSDQRDQSASAAEHGLDYTVDYQVLLDNLERPAARASPEDQSETESEEENDGR
ncbi:TniB family NTP-binding protein [Deinococcus sp.]|uniref:TniB family NTP-binding protein n=1 Tax=Deinococcus sp. TaxID=47478 RepID=UPI0025E3675C|nr:TniB family NTP-binding protein [Deinococcus sp.]